MAHKRKEGYRISATLNDGTKTKFTSYAKNNDMKESEVIKEAIRQLLKKS